MNRTIVTQTETEATYNNNTFGIYDISVGLETATEVWYEEVTATVEVGGEMIGFMGDDDDIESTELYDALRNIFPGEDDEDDYDAINAYYTIEDAVNDNLELNDEFESAVAIALKKEGYRLMDGCNGDWEVGKWIDNENCSVFQGRYSTLFQIIERYNLDMEEANLRLAIEKRAEELIEKLDADGGELEIREGVYLATKEEMIEQQKAWGENDLQKTFDFGDSDYVLNIIGAANEPLVCIDTAEELVDEMAGFVNDQYDSFFTIADTGIERDEGRLRQTDATTDRANTHALEHFFTVIGLENPKEFRRVTQEQVSYFKKEMMDRGYAPDTVAKMLNSISVIFRAMGANQEIITNLDQGIQSMSMSNRFKTKTLTPGQIKTMLDAPDCNTLEGKRDYAILRVLFCTGCRVSELINLKVDDFYEEKGRAVLRFSIGKGKSTVVVADQELNTALKEYLTISGHGNDMNNYLFLPILSGPMSSPSNLMLSRMSVQLLYKHYADKAGLKDRATYSARASFIQSLESECSTECMH